VKKIESKYGIIVEVLFRPVACAIVDVFQRSNQKKKTILEKIKLAKIE
jgi:hypothetical protein